MFIPYFIAILLALASHATTNHTSRCHKGGTVTASEAPPEDPDPNDPGNDGGGGTGGGTGSGSGGAGGGGTGGEGGQIPPPKP